MERGRRALAAVLGAWMWLCAAVAWAQQGEAGKMPIQSFEAVSDGVVRENLPGWPFLYAAYAAIWILLLGYVIFLWTRQKDLDARIAQVDKRVAQVDEALGRLADKKA